jgi:amino acid transporter
VAALVAMAVLLLTLSQRNVGDLATTGVASPGWSGLGLALVQVLFAYDGWNGYTAMAGEVRDPARTIPRSLAIGVTTVAAVYLVVNLALFSVLPFDELARSSHPATDAMSRIVGPAGASIIALLVMLSTFGCLDATVMMDPRIYVAMAESGLFFRSVAHVHPRWDTPYIAIILNACLAILYSLPPQLWSTRGGLYSWCLAVSRAGRCSSRGAPTDSSRHSKAISHSGVAVSKMSP